jgi:hypothetical protein
MASPARIPTWIPARPERRVLRKGSAPSFRVRDQIARGMCTVTNYITIVYSSTHAPESRIKGLEVNDLIFEFVFRGPLGQDGSGEKGIELLTQDFIFHVERESPRSFPQKTVRFRHPAVSRQITIYFE